MTLIFSFALKSKGKCDKILANLKRGIHYMDLDYEFKDEVMDENEGRQGFLSCFVGKITSLLTGLLEEIYFSNIDKKIRKGHYEGRMAVAIADSKVKDKIIDRMTATFTGEIEKSLSQEGLVLDKQDIVNLDDFLYLINAKYFDSILEEVPTTRREILIDQLLFTTTTYMKNNSIDKFNDDVALEVLEKCIYIPGKIREEIIDEYINTKHLYPYGIRHDIIRSDVDARVGAYLEARREENEGFLPEFDINNAYNFITTIKAVEESAIFKGLNIRSASDLAWDVEFLQKLSLLIAGKYRNQLILEYGENFSNFILVSNLILNTMTYAVENNYSLVDQEIILKSIPSCPYLPDDIKSKVLDEIIEENGLDPTISPYSGEAPKQKIIEFKSNRKE